MFHIICYRVYLPLTLVLFHRRSGGTLLADGGMDRVNLRRAGRWKSDSCVDGYLDNSKALREMCMAGIDKMLGGRKPKPDPKPTTPEVSTFSLSQVVPHRSNVNAAARMYDDSNDSDSDGMVLADLKSKSASAKRRKEKRELIKKAIHRYLGKQEEAH